MRPCCLTNLALQTVRSNLTSAAPTTSSAAKMLGENEVSYVQTIMLHPNGTGLLVSWMLHFASHLPCFVLPLQVRCRSTEVIRWIGHTGAQVCPNIKASWIASIMDWAISSLQRLGRRQRPALVWKDFVAFIWFCG